MLPGLRKERKGLDIPKQTTRESQYVKILKKEKKGGGRAKKTSLQWASQLLYTLFTAVQQF